MHATDRAKKVKYGNTILYLFRSVQFLKTGVFRGGSRI